MKLSIVIPVYNEKNTVRSILKVVDDQLKSLTEISDYEIVMVEDCSTDGTQDVIKAIAPEYPKLRTFFAEVNGGKGKRLQQGFAEANGDLILVQDADMEYDPQDYSVLLGPIVNERADVVYGSRFKGDVGRVLYFWHRVGNLVLTMLSNMFTNINLTDMETCYKLFKAPILKNMLLTSNRFGIEPEMTAKISKIPEVSIYEVPINYYGRTYEEGKKIGWKDGVSALWCIFKFNILTSWSQSFKCSPQEMMSHLIFSKKHPHAGKTEEKKTSEQLNEHLG